MKRVTVHLKKIGALINLKKDSYTPIKIHGDADVPLTNLDVHEVGTNLKITDDPILTDIEVLT